MTNREIFVRLKADASQFKKEMADTSATTRANMDKISTGASLMSAAVLAGFGVMAKKALAAASNLGESVNAVNVTFGDSADGIRKLGADAAESLGLSESAFNGLAVQFSAFATTIAGEGGDVVGVMDDLTTRGSDFASVMNIDVAEAMRVFQSGLTGETEPLRKYGIDLSAAAVGAYAVANGISDSANAMSESEKVQARYALLMEQTSKVSGDFANTSGEAANAQRIFAAQSEDLQAQLGQDLLPVMKDLLGVGQDVVGWMGENTGAVEVLVVALGGLAATVLAVEAAQKVNNARLVITKALTDANAASAGKYAGAVKTLGGAVAVVGLAALIQQLEEVQGRADVATVETESLAGALSKLAAGAEDIPALGDIFEHDNALPMFRKEITTTEDALAAFADSAQQALGSGLADQLERFLGDGGVSRFGEQVRQLDAAFAAMVSDGNVDGAAAAFEAFTAAAAEQGVDLAALKDMFPEYAAALDGAASATQSAADAQGDLANGLAVSTEAVDAAAAAAAAATTAIADMFAAQRDLAGIAMGVVEAESAFQASIDAASASIAANGATLDLNTEQGRANQAALLDIQTATMDNVAANIAADASSATLRATMAAGRDAFVNAAIAAGATADQANRLADSYGLIPSNVNTLVQADATQAIAAAEAALRAMNAIPTYKHVTIDGSVTSAFQSAAYAAAHTNFVTVAKAAGGPIYGPGTSTSDSIPARLSNGEYVVRATSVQKYGRTFFDAVNEARFATGGYALNEARFATGGGVGAAAGGGGVTPAALRAALQGAFRADLQGATITLTGVDPLANSVAARINLALAQGA